MKRIIQFLSPIIFSLLFYMPVSASLIPSPGATEVATQFASELASTWFTDESGREVLGSSMQDVFRRSGFAPSATNTLSWEYKPLNFDPGATLYDSEGNIVDPSNASLAIGRNSFTSETFLFDNSTGEILNIGDSFQTSQTTLNGYKPGSASGPGVFLPSGNVSQAYDPFENFDSFWFTDDRADAIAVYRSEDMTSDKIEYLETLPDASWGVNKWYFAPNNSYPSDSFGFYCVANVPGVCVNQGISGTIALPGGTYGQGVMPKFLLNPGYQQYLTIWNDNASQISNLAVVTNQTNTFGNYTYSMVYPSHRDNPYSRGWEGQNSIYDPSSENPLSGVIMALPVILNNSPGDIINYDNYKNYTINRTTTINNNYDQSSNVTTQNFPIYQTISYPSYSPVYNYYYYYDQAENTPGTGGGDIGDISDPTLPGNIPILSNLNKRFPFSIPWDIYNLVSGLAVERETPYIDTVIHIPVANVDWVLQYDLHAFDDTAQLFRTLFLISFIIALAWFSYDHFFGS